MTKEEKQMYDGSLIVIAEKWDIPARKIGKKDAAKSRVLVSKRAELKSHVELINSIEDSPVRFVIDEDATIEYLKQRAGIKSTPKNDKLEAMRAEYKEKFGKEAKKIWGVKKLTEVLSE